MADNDFVPIRNFVGLYVINKLGIIKSLERIVSDQNSDRKRLIKSRILKHTISKEGYPVITLHKNGNCYSKSIHILLAETFMPTDNIELELNHVDGNKRNFSLSNLEWITHSQNIQHALNNDLFPCGENNYNSKLSSEQVNEIRRKYIPRKYNIYMLAKEYNVNPKTIHRIITNQSRKFK